MFVTTLSQLFNITYRYKSSCLHLNMHVHYRDYIKLAIDKTSRKFCVCVCVCVTLLITHKPHFARLTTGVNTECSFLNSGCHVARIRLERINRRLVNTMQIISPVGTMLSRFVLPATVQNGWDLERFTACTGSAIP